MERESGNAESRPGMGNQFELLGHFCTVADSAIQTPVFNRTVTLRDRCPRMRMSDTTRQ